MKIRNLLLDLPEKIEIKPVIERMNDAIRGYHVIFENGYTLSIQFGFGTYSTNYDLRPTTNKDVNYENNTSTVEIAVWDKNRNWIGFEGGDNVFGYLPLEKISEFVSLVDGFDGKVETFSLNEGSS